MLFSEPLAQTGVPVYAPNLRPPLLDRGEEQLVGCRGCNLTARLAILAGPEWPGWGLPLLGLLLPHGLFICVEDGSCDTIYTHCLSFRAH